MCAAVSRFETSRPLGLAIAVGAAALGGAHAAHAGVVPQCGEPVCSSSFSIFVEGSAMEMGGGQINYDATTGEVTLDFDPGDIRGGGMVVRDGGGNATGITWDAGD